jgi:predicted phage terminase large subunit-like protein
MDELVNTLDAIVNEHQRDMPPEAKRALQDLDFFIEHVIGFRNQPFHKEICNKLSSNPSRLVILLPPGHGKSTICSVFLPLWKLAGNRDLRIGLISASSGQSEEWLRQLEQIMLTNRRLNEYYGPFVPEGKGLVWNANEKVILGRSSKATHLSLLAMGEKGNLLSRRLDLAILDDPLNPVNVSTDFQRQQLSNWMWQILETRVEPMDKGGQIIVVGSRLHPLDLFKDFENRGWPIIRMPVYRPDGTTLWPERYSAEDIAARKESMGSILFSLTYMHDVSGFLGNVFKREWVHYYLEEDLPDRLDVCQGVDLCLTASRTSDYFALATLGYSKELNRVYILDILRTHASLKTQLDSIKREASVFRPSKIIIESNAAQRLVSEQLLNETQLPIKPSPSHGSKETRLMSMFGHFESRRILLKGKRTETGSIVPADSMLPLVEELLAFPRGESDDAMDAVFKALEEITFSGPPPAEAHINTPIVTPKVRTGSLGITLHPRKMIKLFEEDYYEKDEKDVEEAPRPARSGDNSG